MGLDIRKNDTVMVVAGDDKGKKGRVLGFLASESRVVVEGLNMIKKHLKPSSQQKQGGIVEKEAPLHRSNVMLVCPKCSKPTKIGNKILENGKKIRDCKQCGEVIE